MKKNEKEKNKNKAEREKLGFFLFRFVNFFYSKKHFLSEVGGAFA